ncbi:excisionase [Aquitalea sp. FJL05]|nr:excisionase [Aquitalea sp. FJL05]
MKWLKLEKYCAVSGDTKDAIYNRRRNGIWLDGRECKVVQGNIWVNTEAVEKWIEKSKPQPSRAA